jgi:predicted membrane channel-forming protein YqfA (hemolysin III family)
MELLYFTQKKNSTNTLTTNTSKTKTTTYYFKSFGYFGIGAAFFASRFPESCFPGHFDFVGHSHTLWHFCVAAGAFAQYQNVHIYRKNAAVVG